MFFYLSQVVNKEDKELLTPLGDMQQAWRKHAEQMCSSCCLPFFGWQPKQKSYSAKHMHFSSFSSCIILLQIRWSEVWRCCFASFPSSPSSETDQYSKKRPSFRLAAHLEYLEILWAESNFWSSGEGLWYAELEVSKLGKWQSECDRHLIHIDRFPKRDSVKASRKSLSLCGYLDFFLLFLIGLVNGIQADDSVILYYCCLSVSNANFVKDRTACEAFLLIACPSTVVANISCSKVSALRWMGVAVPLPHGDSHIFRF